jgi:hypothetical protein
MCFFTGTQQKPSQVIGLAHHAPVGLKCQVQLFRSSICESKCTKNSSTKISDYRSRRFWPKDIFEIDKSKHRSMMRVKSPKKRLAPPSISGLLWTWTKFQICPRSVQGGLTAFPLKILLVGGAPCLASSGACRSGWPASVTFLWCVFKGAIYSHPPPASQKPPASAGMFRVPLPVRPPWVCLASRKAIQIRAPNPESSNPQSGCESTFVWSWACEVFRWAHAVFLSVGLRCEQVPNLALSSLRCQIL